MTSPDTIGNFIITPSNAAERVSRFVDNFNERVLVVKGVSGIGKSLFLKNLEDLKKCIVYVDVTAFRSSVSIFEYAYRKLTLKNDFTRCLQNQLSTSINISIEDVGNIHINNSDLKHVNIDNSVSVNYHADLSDAPESLLLVKGFDLLVNAAKGGQLILIFDQFEIFVSDDYIAAQITHLIENRQTGKFIISSNRDITFPSISESKIDYYEYKGFTESDSINFLKSRNITNDKVLKKISNFAKGHPWTLKNASDLILAGHDIDISLRDCSQEIKSKYILDIHHKNIVPEHYREIFYYLPLCRIFNISLVADLFDIPGFKIESAISWLTNNLYVTKIGNSGYFRFHDIFHEAQRLSIRTSEQNKIDQAVVDYYLKEKDSTDVSTIEPLYHLQYCEPTKAFEYFEGLYKPALDRNKRNYAALLASQIDLDIITEEKARNWFLFRLGGYYRQFHHHEQAIEVFNKVLRYAQKTNDDVLEAYVLNNLGISLLYTNKLKEASEALEKSLAICKKKNDLVEIEGHNYTDLGLVYQYMGAEYFDKSKVMYELALTKYRSSNASSIFTGMVLQNYAGVLLAKKDYEKTISASLAAEEEYLSSGDLVAGTKCRGIITNALISAGKYREAYLHHEGYRDGFMKIYNQYDLAGETLQLNILSMLSNFYHEHISVALEFAKEVIIGSMYVNDKEHISSIRLITRLCYEAGRNVSRILVKYIATHEDIPDAVKQNLIEHFTGIRDVATYVRDKNGFFHRIGCSRYRMGNFLVDTHVFQMDADLLAAKIQTCECLSQHEYI